MVKEGLLFPVRHPPRVLGQSTKHQPPGEDILREPICNVLLDALSHNPLVNFCNWVISPAFGLFQPSKFGLHKTSSNRKERANPALHKSHRYWVSLWRVFGRDSLTTETQRTQRLHREEGFRDFLCKALMLTRSHLATVARSG